ERGLTRRGIASMWVPDDGATRLHGSAAPIQKWLPALERRQRFVFRDDVEVEYVQDFPTATAADASAALLFVRDPRDAIHSAYRRSQPDLSLDSFVGFPHPQTLLDRASHWAFFVRAWSELPGIRTFRFEDYKSNDHDTLRAALDHLEIDASPDE